VSEPTQAFDVVVIGGGLAGLSAARRSQQLGAKVVVVEKGTSDEANNTRRSGGQYHAAYFDPKTHEPNEFYDAIVKATNGHSRPDTARAWADNVRRALEFLIAEGGVFEKAGAPEISWNRNGPPPLVVEELLEREPKWKGAANDRLLTRMTESFVKAGGAWRPGTRAIALEKEGDAVVGIQVEPRGGGARETIRGRAVVMADGGFQANPELMRKYVTRHTYSNQCSNLDTGDCLQMALAIGAKAVELDAAYQVVVLRDKVTNPSLGHPPWPTMLINAAMVVNGNAERIGDEALPTPPSSADPNGYPSPLYALKRMGGLMSKADAPGDSWVVFDDAVWQTVGRSKPPVDPIMPQSANQHYSLFEAIAEHGGTLMSGQTIAELAQQAGLPVATLERTVAAFNRFCREGTQLDPPRSARTGAIEKAPFYAIPVVPGILFNQGGVLVNGNGQALDEQERAIEGLYAAGGTMGGLMGGPQQGYAGGWSEAAVFGILSAEHAMSRVPIAAK
jgi:fumarate reductase flavoprotein subunit